LLIAALPYSGKHVDNLSFVPELTFEVIFGTLRQRADGLRPEELSWT
jgi:hypothetical protein